MSTAYKSRLIPSRADLAALISMTMGREAAATYRAGARFEPHPPRRTPVVLESAWHPATQLDTRRGTSSANQRGSAEDRRRRKLYLLNTYGNGFTAPCAFCKRVLMFSTMTVDRYPIPGRLGGRYTRDNIRPACGGCNSEDQGRAGALAATGAAP